MRYFAVTRVRGPAWDETKAMQEQDGWPDHARFMNDLAASGFIVIGGPLGAEEQSFLLICDGEDEDAVWSRLAADPWSGSKLEVSDIEPWEILLGHTPQP